MYAVHAVNTKKAMPILQAPKTKQTECKALESIKNKNGGNTFAQLEDKKTSFLSRPAAALSLANPLAQSSWEEQRH